MNCTIKLIWSEDEKFWYSKSMDERFEMTLESDSLDILMNRVRVAVPDILELAGYTGDIELSFVIECSYKLGAVAS